MDADERTQPKSRIQSKKFVTFFWSMVLGSGDTDEGSGGLRYPADMAGIAGKPGLFQGEYVRTLYGKSPSRHLFRAV